MKKKFIIKVLVVTLNLTPLTFLPLFGAQLSSLTVQVQDAAGRARTSFSSTEKITLSIRVQNTAVSTGQIQFSFEIKDAAGNRRLSQSGNSAPASVIGFAGTTLRGIAVTQFYNSPGQYTLTGRATLNGETVVGNAVFTVLSPQITLTYPPNNAQNLIDQPLVFRWVSSGASSYKVYVDDDISFYNALLVAQTVTSFFSYPQNPSDDRQKLASGQVYYWKVEGLDGLGNVVAKSDIPFSFTVKSEAAQSTSRDLAIIDIAINSEGIPTAPGALPLAVFVKNQGGRSEFNVPVNLYVDGAAVPTSPKRIERIEPGKTEKLVFPARPPDEGQTLLANAVIDLFDDNVRNNSMMKQFQIEKKKARRLKPDEIWEIIKRFVTDTEVLAELDGYLCDAVEGKGIGRDEIDELINSLKDGRALLKGVNLKPVE